MSVFAKQYVSNVTQQIGGCQSALDIQHLLEQETERLARLAERFPELRNQIDLALEDRRAYFAPVKE